MKITPIRLMVVLLAVAFIILKLCKVIDWSWWWVLMPVWFGPALIGLGWIINLLTPRARRQKGVFEQKIDEMKRLQNKSNNPYR